jgi:hypothetical protein
VRLLAACCLPPRLTLKAQNLFRPAKMVSDCENGLPGNLLDDFPEGQDVAVDR